MARKPRVYKKGAPNSEYDAYQGKPEQIRRRAQRNKARSDLGLEKGDPKEAGHVAAKRKGKLPRKVRAISFKANRADQPSRGSK